MAVLTEVFECGECGSRFEEFSDEPVYECSRCGGTQVGERRCQECNVFMAKVATASCPECEAPFEEGDGMHMFMAADGSYHETEAEADAWDADAGPREERRIAAEAKHRQEMDARYEEWRQENAAYTAEWLPRLEALTPVLHERLDEFSGEGYGFERDVVRFLDGWEWAVDFVRRADGGRVSVSIGIGIIGVLAGVEEVAERMAVALDYDNREDGRAAEERLIQDVFSAAGESALLSSRRMWHWTAGSSTSFHVDELIPFIESLIGT